MNSGGEIIAWLSWRIILIEILQAAYPSAEQFELAFWGMRSPYNSWRLIDSYTKDGFTIGVRDAGLAKKLCQAGPEHRKFLRQLPVILEINAPLYWWKQMDKYQIGTCTNSSSTMHTIMKRELAISDFSLDGMEDFRMGDGTYYTDYFVDKVIGKLNDLIWIAQTYTAEDEKESRQRAFNAMVEMLPESFNQSRVWSGNYEVLRTICHQREGHKLSEWATFIQWVRDNIPYADWLVFDEWD